MLGLLPSEASKAAAASFLWATLLFLLTQRAGKTLLLKRRTVMLPTSGRNAGLLDRNFLGFSHMANVEHDPLFSKV